jgi:hypothetical protein
MTATFWWIRCGYRLQVHRHRPHPHHHRPHTTILQQQQHIRKVRPLLNCNYCRTITTCCQSCHHKKPTESTSSSSSSSCQFGTSGAHNDDICAYSKLKPPPPTPKPIIITSIIQYSSLVVPSTTIPLTTQLDHHRHPQQEPAKENEGTSLSTTIYTHRNDEDQEENPSVPPPQQYRWHAPPPPPRYYGAQSIQYTATSTTTTTTTKSPLCTPKWIQQPILPSIYHMHTSGSSSSRSRPPLFAILPDWIGPSFFDPRWWIHLFVPAQYPTSVQQPGYTHYAIYTFVASIAGSASMVLSTQTLLMTMMMTTTDIGATTNVINSSTLTDDRENHEMEHCEVTHSLSSTENNTTTLTDTAVAAASSSNTSAAVAAGALNWVFKDGIGQLGGIIVASYMGNLRYLDSNPKRYRMYAALALDIAAWMELCTPYVSVMMTTMTAGSAVGTWTTAAVVVPMACIATVGKNIGFILASASRATIHQALCTTHPTKPVTTTTTTSSSSSQSTKHHQQQQHNNLADVTAKFGSQSTAAGLLGTILGIAISSSCSSGTAPMSILIPFFGLVMIHQGGNYMALRSVALYHLNRQRLGIVLHDYVQQQQQQCFHVHYQKRPDHDSSTSDRYSTNDRPAKIMDKIVLTPAQVAEKEYFLPSLRFLSTFTASRSNDADDDEDNNLYWLAIGCSLPLICPNGPDQLVKLLQACSNEEEYVLNIERTGDASGGRKIQLSFFEPANSHDVLRGMLHAYRLRYELVQQQQQQYQQQMRGTTATTTTTLVHNDDESMMLQLIHHSHTWVQNNFPSFHDALQASGWNTPTTFVEEGRNTYRFAITFRKGTLN